MPRPINYHNYSINKLKDIIDSDETSNKDKISAIRLLMIIVADKDKDKDKDKVCAKDSAAYPVFSMHAINSDD